VSWLKVNGIELARVVAAFSTPEGKRRDIGDKGEAADGTTRITRQTRKRDLNLELVPLSRADALAWEGLLTGEGHVWSFDVSSYSSKGLGPTVFTGSLESTTPSPKYGAKYLQLDIDEDASFVFPAYAQWTISLWFQNGSGVYSGAWHHAVARSDGARWIDGARNDGFAFDGTSVILTFNGTTLQLTGPDPGPAYVDDLIVVPYLWPLNWAHQVYSAGAAFGSTPFLTCAGDVISEASTRRMICAESSEQILIAGGERDKRRLSFSLLGV
jgi:hypothetical protein